MSKKKIIILGAGSTGLSVALGLSEELKKDCVILEKKIKVGGLAGSFNCNNDIVDYGPHRLSIENPKIKNIAENLLGPNLLLKKSQHGVFYKNKIYQFPPRLIDLLSAKTIYEGTRFLISYIIAKFKWITSRFDDDTFKSVIINNFGFYFFENIANPMSIKVWGDTDKIDPTFVAQRFSLIKPKEIIKKFLFTKKNLNPSTFYYPKYGGYQSIWNAMSEKLKNEGVSIVTTEEIFEINLENNKIISIVTKNKNSDKLTNYDLSQGHLVSTIPINYLLKSFKNNNFKDLEKLSSKIRYRSMFLILFKFDQPKTLPFRTMIFPEQDIIFNRLFEQNQYSRECVESGKSLIIADVTFDKNLTYYSKEEVLKKTKKDLKKISCIDFKKIYEENIFLVEYAYVSPEIETKKIFFEIEKKLSIISNLSILGRFSIGEYDNSDYAIINGLNLSKFLNGEINKNEYTDIKNKNSNLTILG
jgi:protoporphyrinogen oxidase